MMLPALPEPLASLTVPEIFPVSAVANFGGCHLKLIASTREWRAEHLISGPGAVLGSVVHRIFELWTSGGTPSDPGELFDQEMKAAASLFRSDPGRAHFADLETTMSFIEWRNLRVNVKARCRLLHRNPEVLRAGTRDRVGKSGIRTGAETSFTSRKLRLAGRSDLIEKRGARKVRIRDFKTGKTFETNGSILPSIALQLGLYALLVEERDPECDIELVVDASGSEHEVRWDGIVRSRTYERLTEVLGGLSSAKCVDARAISSPGSECRFCPIRHRCSAYLETAPGWWKSFPVGIAAVPLDTWGTITAITILGHNATIQIDDAAGRRVKVAGLRSVEEISSLGIGSEVYFFNLEKTGLGRGWNGKPFQPHAFHELPPDHLAQRAWSLQIFGKQTTRVLAE